ncbi:30S ribosomal protein S3 [Candidatus Portiera aleyrodidarum]|uniref:Small ribosomal subunit protein uS3 n=1 Tax=Candidatus Portiera aleyrodidarum TaxID=91844 RepID=A0A6S6S478_9GAMM|nr:30S ribosomal protein S3 [Candidatus Portiera aleyrodidarum]CAA3705299.1 30S ribosomal protein S3 [Candidatus Portiera aleyrodidarum]
MGKKVNPIGMRLGIRKNHLAIWFAERRNYSLLLKKDIEVRKVIEKRLKNVNTKLNISRICIERTANNASVIIYTARPGIVIGKNGEEVDKLRNEVNKIMGIKTQIEIEEIKKPEIDAKIIAQNIAVQLENRVMFRRAMKRAVQNATRLGAKGVKIKLSGRLGGAEIARKEWYKEGRVPLHTLRANIDYYKEEAFTNYGVIGIKVWVFKGEILGTMQDVKTLYFKKNKEENVTA